MKNKEVLAAKSNSKKAAGLQRRDGYISQLVKKSISRTRADIAGWNAALKMAQAENPKRSKLLNLYNEVQLDALVTSQIENRRLATLGSPFCIKDASGNINEDVTELLRRSPWVRELNKHILDSRFFGHSLVEIFNDENGIKICLLKRENVRPEIGLYTPDETRDEGTFYRDVKEYGVWLLEFGDNEDFGLLNKAIPHVLFKRYAQSCWSELCEIYGIPPRVMKTNTQDPLMLDRAEAMMRDMGAAAWFIIDDTETFEFAKGTDTNGDVYKNLIALCNSEISLLISGAIIGQDTEHGNRSKEEGSIKMLDTLVAADKTLVQGYWNSKVLPALYLIGIIPDGCNFEFQPEEDIAGLWKMVVDIAPHKEVKSEWIKEKFGIEVADKTTASPNKLDTGFFD